jgi:predicted DCC family thiol-disulfide oxidoreductase YuxK
MRDGSQMSSLTVYYDELCVLCSAEINHYKKQRGSEQITFVDITADSFDAAKEGINPFEAHKIMHAKNKDGKILTKIDSFVAIWALLPKYRWLYNLAQWKVVRFFMDIGYIIFAALRPYLPRKNKKDCQDSPFCEIQTPRKKS